MGLVLKSVALWSKALLNTFVVLKQVNYHEQYISVNIE